MSSVESVLGLGSIMKSLKRHKDRLDRKRLKKENDLKSIMSQSHMSMMDYSVFDPFAVQENMSNFDN